MGRIDDGITAPALPYRQLSRLGLEFRASIDALLTGMFPNRYAESLLFLAVARVCTPDWVDGHGIAPPAEPNVAITINAIASSLDRPFETTRRHAAQLIDEGVFVRTKAGIALSTTSTNARSFAGFYAAAHDLLVRHIEDMAATCDLDLPSTTGRRFTSRDVVVRALDIALMPLGGYLRIVDHWLAMLIWSVVRTANARRVTHDPALARRYATVPVPDGLLAPISLNAVARAIQLPYATAWRHCQQLERQGILERDHRGWRAGAAYPGMDLNEAAIVDYQLRRIRELAMLGLDLHAVADLYLGERPDAVTL